MQANLTGGQCRHVCDQRDHSTGAEAPAVNWDVRSDGIYCCGAGSCAACGCACQWLGPRGFTITCMQPATCHPQGITQNVPALASSKADLAVPRCSSKATTQHVAQGRLSTPGKGKMHCSPRAIACSPRVPPSTDNPGRCPIGPDQQDRLDRWTLYTRKSPHRR